MALGDQGPEVQILSLRPIFSLNPSLAKLRFWRDSDGRLEAAALRLDAVPAALKTRDLHQNFVGVSGTGQTSLF